MFVNLYAEYAKMVQESETLCPTCETPASTVMKYGCLQENCPCVPQEPCLEAN
jgi:hypothetical protein